MPRLSDAEREARRKARVAFSFSDAAYDHYNPEKEGYGSPDQWEEIARKMLGLKKFAKASKSSPNKYLAALYLEIMPVTFEALKDAFRKAMFKSHPDYGGSNEAARDTLEAFAILKKEIRVIKDYQHTEAFSASKTAAKISAEVAAERVRCAALAEDLASRWEASAQRMRDLGTCRPFFGFGKPYVSRPYERNAESIDAAARGLRTVAKLIREGVPVP